MLYIIWRFRAKAEDLEEFRKTYCGDGDWAKLFVLAPGYHSTELLQDADDPLVFVVIDRWGTRESYDRFRDQYRSAYDDLDQRCDALTDEETLIGHFSDEQRRRL